MANIPHLTGHADSIIGAGFGSFNGETAFAIGGSIRLEDSHTILRGSGAYTSQGDVALGLGVAWEF